MKNATLFDFARMCNTIDACDNCPIMLNITKHCNCSTVILNHTDEVNDIVTKWCKEHPVNTLQNKFLSIFPNAKKDENGVIDICPLIVDDIYIEDSGVKCGIDSDCEKCQRNYWLKEIK